MASVVGGGCSQGRGNSRPAFSLLVVGLIRVPRERVWHPNLRAPSAAAPSGARFARPAEYVLEAASKLYGGDASFLFGHLVRTSRLSRSKRYPSDIVTGRLPPPLHITASGPPGATLCRKALV